MKSRLSKQFFITYVLFFICLVLLFIPLYQTVSSLFARNYRSTSLQLMETGLQRLEAELQGISAIVQDDFGNPDIVNVRFLKEPYSTDDYYRTITATTEFKGSVSKMNAIRDCGIVLSNDIIITSSRIHFTGEDFYGDYFSVAGIGSYDEWKQSLTENPNISNLTPLQSITSLDNRSYEALTYIIRMPLASARSNSFFYATIDTENLLSYFATREMLDNSVLTLSDMGGNVLYSHGQSAGSGLTFIEGESAKLGIRLSMGISRDFFAGKLRPLKMIGCIFFALYILTGLLLSVLFAYRSSKPIRSIVDTAASIEEHRLHSPASEHSHGEYQYLMDFLSQTDSAFENYEQVLSQQKELTRSNFFERLIRGLIYSASTFERAHICFPGFPDSYRLAALMLSGLRTLDFSAYAARQSLILSVVIPKLPGKAYVHFSGIYLLILLPVDPAAPEVDIIERLLLEIRDELIAKAEIDSSVALSDEYTRMEELHLAFSQARHILRLVGRTPARRVYRREDFPQHEPWLNPDPLDDTRFYELIVRTEREQALDMVDAALRRMHESGYINESEIQQVFYSYRRTFMYIRNELSEPLRSRLTLPVYDPALDIDMLFAGIKGCIDTACACIEAQQHDENEAFERSVLTYVNDNIDDADLYIKSVILHFGITENKLQCIFRKLTGKSFFEYVESQRMAKAERLVCHTFTPISDLIGECGYSTLNSFYKAFRRNFGISPSTMRKKQYRSS